MITKICFCTLRDNKGATGGPGGVLYLQKEVLGESICGLKCKYWFNTYIGHNVMNKIVFFLKCLFSRNTYFFTHDITSGWILAMLGRRYSLVFHSQGPMVEEMQNLGIRNSKIKAAFLKYRERSAFVHANTLHFPSIGAADMYFVSKYASCKRDEVNLRKPLYNIILQTKVQRPDGFQLSKEDNTLTFFSLGTLTVAKGQDQSVEFLAEFLKYYNYPVRYIFVGKGPMKNHLLKRLEEIKTAFVNFKYHYFDALPHDVVMYIHNISDVYLMMHRISIFDFATLEAMSQSSAVVLSRVGGNPEFNYNGNVIFAENAQNDMASFAKQNFDSLKKQNKEVFDKYFSKEAFRCQYENFVTNVVIKS